ncbi:TonB-dependent receptor plug domain-containing protein [Klebsiella pneumoniae]|nr:TonB-dependent receptor plug domain-containing protein [Klebsiella pneumoniae]
MSIITAEDIAKQPPVNDLSDIIRKMPGVNLTGNSASGSRGNNRQIDIRGMGPAKTPDPDRWGTGHVDATRFAIAGAANAIPGATAIRVFAEMVERIAVLRGPAAARYGSGAAGGVVNIITKRPTNTWHGSLSFFTNQPEKQQRRHDQSR